MPLPMLSRLGALSLASIALFGAPEPLHFNRDIRPILSDKCFSCHGSDAASKGIKLRLDSETAAKADLGGRFAVVPGDTANSHLVQRITTPVKGRKMPPVYSHLELTPKEIDTLTRWVQEGARWERHWSFLAPRKADPPQVVNGRWSRNPIDRFILARLEEEGLQPSAEASRETLLRRVSLDLTGLPPSVDELERFLADTTPDAYEKAVDRLLASPHYGERMAFPWLEASRYADTNGYQTDAERFMWRWRDWVIDSFNQNLPYDQFVTEQIAGDLLPGAKLNQVIATGFNRNHRGNGEGGIIAEEYAAEYVADRTETAGTVFMGLTIGCARCHNHKYDPLTQREFYKLFAYFNNIPEKGRAFKYGNSPPLIKAPTPPQEVQLRKLDDELAAARSSFEAAERQSSPLKASWEQKLASAAPVDWTPSRDLAFSRDQEEVFDGKRLVEEKQTAKLGFNSRFTISAWIRPQSPTGAIFTCGKDETEESGLGVYLVDGKIQANFAVRWLDDAVRVETVDPVALGRWSHVAVTYGGELISETIKIYVDGVEKKLKINVDELNQNFVNDNPFRIGGGGGLRFNGAIRGVRVYKEVLSAERVSVLALGDGLHTIAAIAPVSRTPAQAAKLRLAFLEKFGPEAVQTAWNQRIDTQRSRDKFYASIPTVMVMEEMSKRRQSYVLLRGAYDRPGDPVEPGVPEVLPPLPGSAPNNRLGLAQWLVNRNHPLTARVAVNRYWQQIFGVGLVKTVEDFGSQGAWPSHMELLDWLAVEFMDSGWDVKKLIRMMVTSATYRQSSRVTPELLKKDPENRLLSRAPRFRLSADAIRDQALAASGLLVGKIGGPSVKPYQPAGLWKDLSGGADYPQDHGENLYRRSLYTFWKRASAPPSMANFDAAGREACMVRQTRTNTPLQALNLMNDVQFLEAARVLATQSMRKAGASPEAALTYMFRAVTARTPQPAEVQTLVSSFQHFSARYEADPAAARKFLRQGESPLDESLPPAALASYTAVASMIFNLDEAITKE